MELTENVIEFITGQRTACITFSDPPHIRKIKKLHEEIPDEFNYFVENEDGSICFKVPLKWVKVTPPKKHNKEYTEEERAVMRERFNKALGRS